MAYNPAVGIVLFIFFTIMCVGVTGVVATRKHRSPIAWSIASGGATTTALLAHWLLPWTGPLATSTHDEPTLFLAVLRAIGPLVAGAIVLAILARLPELDPRQVAAARAPKHVDLPECLPGVFLDARSTSDFPCALVLTDEGAMYFFREPETHYVIDADTLIRARAEGDVVNLHWRTDDGDEFKGCFRPLDVGEQPQRIAVSAALARWIDSHIGAQS